jgi:hypothetical protein
MHHSDPGQPGVFLCLGILDPWQPKNLHQSYDPNVRPSQPLVLGEATGRW